MIVVAARVRLRMAMLALAASAACSSAPQEEPAAPAAQKDGVSLSKTSQQLAGITVETVKAEAVGSVLEAVGTVALDDTRTARVGALVEGIVSATHANVGDRVRQGALLAGLHSHEVHDGWGDYRKAIADRRRVEQELAFANETVARTERLLADKAASALEVERARSSRASATEQLVMANAEVRRAQESLEHLGIEIGNSSDTQVNEIIPVRTPQGGVVLEKLVTTGTTVTPGTALFVVSDISSLWVLAEIDEAALARVRVGAPVDVVVSAYPGERFAATVTLDRRHDQPGHAARRGAMPGPERERPPQARHVRARAARRRGARTDGARARRRGAGSRRSPRGVRAGRRRPVRRARRRDRRRA